MASRDFSQDEESLDVNMEKSNIYIQGGHSNLDHSDFSSKMGPVKKGSTQVRKSVNDGLPKI
jgi:hypothetical protein